MALLFNSRILLAYLTILLTVFLSVFYINPRVLPLHDSMQLYQTFEVFYANILSYHQIPLWFPYLGYGMSANMPEEPLILPMFYLVSLLGLIFEIKNTLLLYNIGLFSSAIVYFFGIYLFAKDNYQNAITRCIVIFSALLSLGLIWQPGLNFFIFYLIPLTLYCAIKFIKTTQLKWLLFSCLLFSLNQMGYFLILQFYILLICLIPLFIQRFGAIKSEKTRITRELFSPFVLTTLFVLIIFFISILICMHSDMTVLSPQRDPKNFSVTLVTFLSYAVGNLGQSLYGLISGQIYIGDNTYYVGLLPIIVFIYGLFTLKNRVFIGLGLACLFLFAFSQGGLITRLSYYLPAMKYYRHVGLTFGLFGCLLILASGFAIDALLNKNRPRVFVTALSVAAGMVILDHIITWRSGEFWVASWGQFHLFHSLFLLRSLIYGACGVLLFYYYRNRTSQQLFSMALLLAVLFDLGSYQYLVLKNLPHFNSAQFSALTHYEGLSIAPTREETNTKLALLDVLHQKAGDATYVSAYPFVGLDPCYPNYRMDLISKPVFNFLTVLGGQPGALGPGFFGKMSPKFQNFLGCHAPKWHLFNSYIFTNNPSQQLINLKDPLNTLIVSLPNALLTEAAIANPNSLPQGKIIPEKLTPNRVEFLVKNPSNHDVFFSYADAYSTHWRAFLDTHKTPLYVADVGFKGVLIPPGSHQVILRYGNWLDWFARYFIALLGLASPLIIFFILRGQRRDAEII